MKYFKILKTQNAIFYFAILNDVVRVITSLVNLKKTSRKINLTNAL